MGGDSKDATVTGRKPINAYRREDGDRTNAETAVGIPRRATTWWCAPIRIVCQAISASSTIWE
jgi:hypothetical protein